MSLNLYIRFKFSILQFPNNLIATHFPNITTGYSNPEFLKETSINKALFKVFAILSTSTFEIYRQKHLQTSLFHSWRTNPSTFSTIYLTFTAHFFQAINLAFSVESVNSTTLSVERWHGSPSLVAPLLFSQCCHRREMTLGLSTENTF